jgi:indole-3-glycerol phosphate synthase
VKKTGTILDDILRDKAADLERLKSITPLESIKSLSSERKTPARDFAAALGSPGKLRVIAEIKKASPSGGVIRNDFDPIAIAREYEKSGLVDAISIITETPHFQGNPSWVAKIRKVTTMPLFRKDFIFDEYQIYESFVLEADALLLIAAALEEEQLHTLISITRSLGMETLVETHSQEEVKMALRAGAAIVGINARDLKTFILDRTLFDALAPHIPDGKIKVAESGLESRADMIRVKNAGANAVLVGTSIMKSDDIPQTLAHLFAEL